LNETLGVIHQVFKQRKHKQFNYKPRFQGLEEKHAKHDFENKWKEVRQVSKRRGRIWTSLPALVVILIALFILMYVLDGYMK
jgi:hypothetical protein